MYCPPNLYTVPSPVRCQSQCSIKRVVTPFPVALSPRVRRRQRDYPSLLTRSIYQWHLLLLKRSIHRVLIFTPETVGHVYTYMYVCLQVWTWLQALHINVCLFACLGLASGLTRHYKTLNDFSSPKVEDLKTKPNKILLRIETFKI